MALPTDLLTFLAIVTDFQKHGPLTCFGSGQQSLEEIGATRIDNENVISNL